MGRTNSINSNVSQEGLWAVKLLIIADASVGIKTAAYDAPGAGR